MNEIGIMGRDILLLVEERNRLRADLACTLAALQAFSAAWDEWDAYWDDGGEEAMSAAVAQARAALADLRKPF